MKKSITLLLAILTSINIFSQAPEKMSYQAVIRNSSNQLVVSSTVGMRISILQGSAEGTVVYTETQTPTTNANGLVSIEIGGGAGFSSIDWSTGTYFIKTETDPLGGTTYSIEGTSQILSVPYALYAGRAANVEGLLERISELEGVVYNQLPIPTDGLVGYWSFTGNANDSSGNNHHGTVNGATITTDRFGNANGAYSFDGVNDYIYITNSSLVSGGYASISLWVKTDGTNQGYPIISGNQNDYNIFVNKDSVMLWIVTNKPSGSSPVTSFTTKYGYLPPNQWNHIVLNYDGTTLKMFINNILSNSSPATGQIYTPQSDYLAFGIYFLNGNPQGTSTYKGILDDVRIYNRALNNVEISYLYHEGGW